MERENKKFIKASEIESDAFFVPNMFTLLYIIASSTIASSTSLGQTFFTVNGNPLALRISQMWTNWAAIETRNHFSSGGVIAQRIE